MKAITLLFLISLSLFLYSCASMKMAAFRSYYPVQDPQCYAATCDTCTSMAVRHPLDAIMTAIRFYKKNFRKSVLVPDVNHFEVSLLNDSVWHVESPLVYKRLSYPTIRKYGFSDTGVLLISRKDANVLYFSIHQLSSIKETYAQEVKAQGDTLAPLPDNKNH